MPIPNAASATFTAQAEPDSLDFDIISGAMNGTGVMSGCACTPASSGVTLGVAVALGSVQVAGTTVAVTAGTVTPGAASGSNPRFDLIVSNVSGTKSVIAGTAAAAPVFPAAPPSTYAVLCAVWIPTSATSITANNIIDKRQQMLGDAATATASMRSLGTASTQAAAGDHVHAGTYASTAHAATHAVGGSDALAVAIAPTDIHPIRQVSVDGTGFDRRVAQTTIPTSEMATENEQTFWTESVAWRPTRMMRSYWNTVQTPDVALWGPDCPFVLWPGTGTTMQQAGAPFTQAGGTVSHPSPTTANGFHTNLLVSSAGTSCIIGSTDTRWCVGDVVNPWTGLFMACRFMLPDASYANSGVTTGSRIFVGFTDQTMATMLATDNPAGNRFGLEYVNINAGRVQTTFNITVKDNTTEKLTNTLIGLTQNLWYDVFLHIQGNYSSFTSYYVQLRNAATQAVLYDSTAITGNGPLGTAFMRAGVGIWTTNAVSRNLKLRRLVVETPVY